ncbi:MAG: hypothetical protein AAFX80_02930 [Cyanobacteria bacterium J06639_18]
MDIFADINEASKYVLVGAAVGAYAFHQIGGAGLAIGGAAYPITLSAFAGTGAVVGLAAFGAKKSVFG